MISDGNTKYTVAILDDEPSWISAIEGLLKRDDHILLAGTATTQTQAVNLAKLKKPDVFLVDMLLNHPRQTGVSATLAICSASPITKVIILTSSEKRENVLDAITAGAVDYLLKSDYDELLPMIHRHMKSGFSPTETLAKEVLNLRKAQVISLLSDQEMQIIECAASNIPRSQFAAVLHKSESTIKSQISSIVRKLKVKNMAEAIDLINSGGIHFPRRE